MPNHTKGERGEELIEKFIDKFHVMLERSLYTEEELEEVYDFLKEHSQASYLKGVKEGIENIKVGALRQWLNEDRITDPNKMVTNVEIWKILCLTQDTTSDSTNSK